MLSLMKFSLFFFLYFRECLDMLEYREWKNETLKRQFRAGVMLGIGTFNLVRQFERGCRGRYDIVGRPSRLKMSDYFFFILWSSLVDLHVTGSGSQTYGIRRLLWKSGNVLIDLKS